ncbi:MAG: 4a-hydroxytetrahydrobiopterin dehydratase [Pelovirga sp.]
MHELSNRQCRPCAAGAAPLGTAEVAGLLATVPGWTLEEDQGVPRLCRCFRFRNFRQALDFSNRVGTIAEEQGHHPQLITEWGQTTVCWWTHKIAGLHQNDFIMAARTSALFERP